MDVTLKLDLNLQRLSAIKVATLLWQNERVKAQLDESGLKILETKTQSVFDSEIWHRITNNILKYAESLDIPTKAISAKEELRSAIVLIGEKVLFWLSYLEDRWIIGFEHSTRFFFTCNGSIDETKTYQHWQRIPGFYNNDMNKLCLHFMASRVADTKFLIENMKESVRLIEMYAELSIKDLKKFKAYSAMTIFILCAENDGDTENFKKAYAKLKSPAYPTGADKMFVTCVASGHKKAAEYYYKKLKEKDRDQILHQAAKKCVENVEEDLFRTNYSTERIPEVLAYVINKMSRKERREFLLAWGDSVFVQCARMWPFQQICMPLLNYVWNNLDFSQMTLLLRLMLDFVTVYTKKFDFVQNYTFLPLLKSLLAKLPGLVKLSYVPRKDIIFELFEIKNFDSIKVIVDDCDLKKQRFSLLDISKHLEDFIIKGGATNQINEYMKYFQLSKKERKKLIKFSERPVFVLKILFQEDRFSEADDYFAWLCEIHGENEIEQKENLKKEFYPVEFCAWLIEDGKSEILKKFMKWMYDTDEIQEIKTEIFSTDFICNRIWKKVISKVKHPYEPVNLKECKTEFTKLLKNYLKTDDKLSSFKEEILQDGKLIKIFFDAESQFWLVLYYAKAVSLLGDLLECLSIPNRKINELKKKIRNNIDWWLDSYPKKFLFLNSLIDWACTEEQKENIIKNFIHTSRGAVMCYEVLTEMDRQDNSLTYTMAHEVRKVLLKDWVKKYGTLDVIKKEVLKLKKADFVTKKDFLSVIKQLGGADEIINFKPHNH